MSLNITFRSRSRRTDEVLRSYQEKVKEIVDETTRDVQQDYAAGVGYRTGELREGILDESAVEEITPLKNRLHPKVKHAFWHEFGFKGFAGNPALRRAIEKHRAAFKAKLNRLIRRNR